MTDEERPCPTCRTAIVAELRRRADALENTARLYASWWRRAARAHFRSQAAILRKMADDLDDPL